MALSVEVNDNGEALQSGYIAVDDIKYHGGVSCADIGKPFQSTCDFTDQPCSEWVEETGSCCAPWTTDVDPFDNSLFTNIRSYL